MIDDNFFPYFFLFFAIYSIWLLENRTITIALTVIAILLSLVIELLTIESLAFIGLFALGCYAYFLKPLSKASKFIAWFIVFSIGYMLLKHMVPGVVNWRLVDNAELSTNAYNYSLWMNIDTALVGLIIFVCALDPIKTFQTLKESLLQVKFAYITAIISVIVIAISLGVVQFDPKFPSLWLLWILVNLSITCVSEEAFYRFFLLNSIQGSISNQKIGSGVALIASSIVFTLMHSGPIQYLIIVCVAGLFYGYVYQSTKRIEASILLHFFVNLIHFFFFTYPMLRVDYGM